VPVYLKRRLKPTPPPHADHRIHDPETTIAQLIELIRELRMILKAIIPA